MATVKLETYNVLKKELESQGLDLYVKKMNTFLDKVGKQQRSERMGGIIRGRLEIFFANAVEKLSQGEKIEPDGEVEESALSLAIETVEAMGKKVMRGKGRVTEDANEALKILEEIIKRDEVVLTVGSDRGVWVGSLNNQQGKQVIVSSETLDAVLADAVGKWVRKEYSKVEESN